MDWTVRESPIPLVRNDAAMPFEQTRQFQLAIDRFFLAESTRQLLYAVDCLHAPTVQQKDKTKNDPIHYFRGGESSVAH